jgi:hypothetical protein
MTRNLFLGALLSFALLVTGESMVELHYTLKYINEWWAYDPETTMRYAMASVMSTKFAGAFLINKILRR